MIAIMCFMAKIKHIMTKNKGYVSGKPSKIKLGYQVFKMLL